MDIDPQAELTLKLTDDGKAYSFKPWTVRQMRAYQSLVSNQDLQLTEFTDKALAILKDGFNGDADTLEDLVFHDLMKLLGKRYNACFASPDDKKKSES
jgi:hypothetical protein